MDELWVAGGEGVIAREAMIPKEILKKIKRLEIKTSRLVEGAMAGGYLSTFKGRGIEFNEVREYTEGDDVRSIDWNVTARMGAPFVKTFMEERDLTVVLVVDLSGSMEFGTVAQSKRELALDFCAAAALLAVQNNDRVGLIAHTDRIELFVPPRKGRRHAMRLLMEIASLKPAGSMTGYDGAAGFLLNTVKRRATVFWVSDFIGMGLTPSIKAAARRHELVPALLQDVRETQMPDVGLMELVDPETGARVLADTSSSAFKAAYSGYLKKRDDARAVSFRGIRSEPVELWTGASPVKPLARYFHRQARLRRR